MNNVWLEKSSTTISSSLRSLGRRWKQVDFRPMFWRIERRGRKQTSRAHNTRYKAPRPGDTSASGEKSQSTSVRWAFLGGIHVWCLNNHIPSLQPLFIRWTSVSPPSCDANREWKGLATNWMNISSRIFRCQSWSLTGCCAVPFFLSVSVKLCICVRAFLFPFLFVLY